MKGDHRISSALALSLAGTMLFASIHPAAAEDAKTDAAKPAPAKTQQTSQTEKADMKVSQDGFKAMRAIHDARMAIFNGEPKVCGKLLNTAGHALAAAAKDESIAKVKGDMIPIDGNLALADTFVASEEKAKHIAAANEHFKKGDAKAGIEELKLGEIDVNYSRLLISVAGTKKHLDAAEGFAKEHKYYECNLALKAAEDSVVLDSVSLLEFPKAGATATKTDATATKTESKPEEKTQK